MLLSFLLSLLVFFCFCVFFFFKQKTAYEMRISDWSSDVCSSDLLVVVLAVVLGSVGGGEAEMHRATVFELEAVIAEVLAALGVVLILVEIGRASCRERVCQYV